MHSRIAYIGRPCAGAYIFKQVNAGLSLFVVCIPNYCLSTIISDNCVVHASFKERYSLA